MTPFTFEPLSDPGGGQCDIVVEGGLPVAFYKTPPDVDKTRIDVTPD